MKKRQPPVLQQPRLAHPAVLALPNVANRAALSVAELFRSPPDIPNFEVAIFNTEACIQEALVMVPGAIGHVETFLQGLQIYLSQRQTNLPQPMALAGRKQKFPQWDLITTDFERYLEDVPLIIGLELIHAYLLQMEFNAQLSVRLGKIAAKEQLISTDQAWLSKKVAQKLIVTNKTVTSLSTGLTTGQERLNFTINSYLLVQFNSQNYIGRQAAGRRNELLKSDYLTLLPELRAKVEQGDYTAACRCTAFCMGITVPLTEDIPVVVDDKCKAILHIRADLGTHYSDLGVPLSGLAKVGPVGSVPALRSFHCPFPVFLANFWKHALVNNPRIAVVRDASVTNRSKFISRIETVISAAISVTEARLIATRGSAFLDAGVRRDTAAYAASAPFLMEKADFHYIHVTPHEIWEACNRAFQYVGWGDAVPRPAEATLAVGTKKSPEAETVIKKISALKEALENSRTGKRATLGSLAMAHNAFVVYVAFMLMLSCGGRHRVKVSFKANAWKSGNPFGVHIDKASGANKSRVQSPLPPYLSVTLDYLLIHYKKLDDRLEKLGIDKTKPVRVWIAEILNGKCVNLLFKFDKRHLPRDLALQDVISKTDALSGDTFRHFVPKALEKSGVQFEYIQAWLKHHASGNSSSSVTFRTPPVVWLSRVATALGDLAFSLGLTPCHGISKG